MQNIETTKMTSKGQVVIPEKIRTQLGLEPGEKFVVVGDKDVVVLKRISPPLIKDFHVLIAEAREQAKKAGLKQTDIAKAILEVRTQK